MRYLSPEGRTLARSGVFAENSLKRSRGSCTPARPAIATRWMSALVEPPIAISATMPLSKDSFFRISRGFRSSHTISTMRLPARLAIFEWFESGAGMDEAPGSASPRVSAMDIMVAALPVALADVAGAQLRPVFPRVRARTQRVLAPVTLEHRAGRHVDRRQVHAGCAHHQGGRGLIAAAHQHRAIGGIGAQQLLAFHRQEITVHHGGRLLHRLRERKSRAFCPE